MGTTFLSVKVFKVLLFIKSFFFLKADLFEELLDRNELNPDVR